ncbi:hypothetical protein [Thioflexithrix psekupsensis]|jgi:hypothetical protein|uniref:Uncharacterized protein n=1 Tax=Thioflexithrix psekupsensis TaxID=1570016 RepID=A0A251XB50_9GAMM|nr:hypothetical protein [Thioflexithrix psekupsensis]OUD15661.1 hypothetical protein TPSD3_03840 [Thioflexithrix psekupsensis]
MIHFALVPVGLLVAIKAYLIAHGTAIATKIIIAAIIAWMAGNSPKKAALKAGATESAADLLQDFFNGR